MTFTGIKCPRPHCGGDIYEESGEEKCLLCARPYTRQDAGRLGGLQTSLRYGSGHYSAIGKTGGRPRLEAVPEAQNKNEGERLPTGLKELRELYRQRREVNNGVLASPL